MDPLAKKRSVSSTSVKVPYLGKEWLILQQFPRNTRNEKKNVHDLKHTWNRITTDITMEDTNQKQYKYSGHHLLLWVEIKWYYSLCSFYYSVACWRAFHLRFWVEKLWKFNYKLFIFGPVVSDGFLPVR